MSREDILRMAREAGLARRDDMTQFDSFMFALPDRLERFAALVSAHEREACALVCETEFCGDDVAYYVATAIRARGEK